MNSKNVATIKPYYEQKTTSGSCNYKVITVSTISQPLQ